jgi:YfiH family protein
MNASNSWLIPEWPAPKNVLSATTLRTGGVSDAPFASLNPALHVGDDPVAVQQNRNLIKIGLALPDEPKWLNQTHSDIVLDAAGISSPVTADASFTDQPGVVCAVMTADCLPVLVCSRDGQKIAAIHAGWRGLLAGIISNTIKALQTHDVLVWLGPAIGADSFEVGAEVLDAFREKSPTFATAFTHPKNGKCLADIYQLARLELQGLGISGVYGGGFCTVSDQQRFFSYRRDQVTGRMATLIWRV